MAVDSAEEGGHPDAAAHVGADADDGGRCRQHAALPARGAADGASAVVRVQGPPVYLVGRLHPEAELGDIGDGEGDGAGVHHGTDGVRVAVPLLLRTEGETDAPDRMSKRLTLTVSVHSKH